MDKVPSIEDIVATVDVGSRPVRRRDEVPLDDPRVRDVAAVDALPDGGEVVPLLRRRGFGGDARQDARGCRHKAQYLVVGAEGAGHAVVGDVEVALLVKGEGADFGSVVLVFGRVSGQLSGKDCR